MAGEQGDSLPREASEWVDERATELDLDRAEVIRRALTAYRHLVEDGDALAAAAEDLPEDREDLEAVEERLDDLDARVGEVESTFDEKIQDVRERVVQVKREADGKAAEDHDHPDIESDVRDAERAAGEAEQTASEAVDRVEDVEDALDRGFENFEDILSFLTDETEDLDGKLDTLAGAVVDLRHRVAELEGESSVERAVAELRTEANRNGIRTANCEDCGSSVDIALLDEPACPECNETFERVEPSRGFFGSATLRVGSRPALIGNDEPAVETPADLFDETAEADGGESKDE